MELVQDCARWQALVLVVLNLWDLLPESQQVQEVVLLGNWFPL
jgi:hypothetical protein